MNTSVYPVIGDKVPNPCDEQLDLIAYFGGATTDVPTLELGNLVFKGATVPYPAQGVGYHNRGSVFSIPFASILTGGAGVKVRTCTTPEKKKLRFRVLDSDACSINSGLLSIKVEPITTCERPFLHDQLAPFVIGIDNCVGTAEKKAKAAVAAANAIPYNPTVATPVQIGAGWYIEIEAVDAKTNFTVRQYENVEAPTVVAPYTKGGFFAKFVNHAFTSDIIGQCDADKCLPGIQIFFEDKIPVDGSSHITSNIGQNTVSWAIQTRSITVLYDSSNTNATNAYTALVGLLNASDQYWDRMAATTSEDLVEYAFSIVRVDTGDNSALTTANGVYAVSGKTTFERAGYANGKSVYVLKKTNTTTITPDANGSNPDDVVYRGYVKTADVV